MAPIKTGDTSTGLVVKNVETGDNKPASITIQTGETTIAADEELGSLNFQAPDEASDDDSRLIAAAISAVAEDAFSTSANKTKLSFKTGASEAASEKMSLSSTGTLKLKETDAALADTAGMGQLWIKDESPCELYFTTDAGDDIQLTDGTSTAGGGGGTDRFTISNRFRAGALGNTARVYFTDDVDTSGNQFYVATKYATHGATIAIDSDWLSGFEGGPQWQAPRACTLTQIAATSRINANASCHSVRVSVWKATPVNNNTWSTDITWTEIGTADLTNDGATTLTDYELQTINTAISSGNSISAADCVIIGFQPIGGTTAATSYFQVTLEFTVS